MAKIATIASVSGKAFAIGADGKVRPLKAGDLIEKDEIVQTAAGAHVELKMVDGQALAVAAEQNVKIDDSLVQAEQRPTAQEAAVVPATADAVIQALERGGDLNQELEAPAAGLGGGAGGQGNAGFVRLLRIVEGVDPLAYQYTPPELGAVQSLEDQALAVAEPPVINVSVAVGVGTQFGGGEGSTGLITAPAVGAKASAIDIIEGTGKDSKAVTFLISLDKVATSSVTVTYTIVPVSASNPGDYFDSATTGTVTIPAGYSGFYVTENIVQDALAEGNEQFKIVLSKPIGATLLNDTATVTIVDDDISLTATNQQVDETGGLDSVNGTLSINYQGAGSTPVIALSATSAQWNGGTKTLAANDGSWKVVVNTNPDGTYAGTYTFTQLKAMSHPDTSNSNDSIDVNFNATVTTTVTVNGVSYTSTDTEAIKVAVFDDGPVAVADSNSVSEDATAAITGNVLSNDAAGADTPASFVSWTSTAASYGTFSDTGNGTYSYTLDNSKAAVQALDAGETLTESLSYTMKDADGDEKTATLTITINGTNDVPTITTDSGNPGGANDQVNEAALATGSNPSATGEFAYGTFKVSDADGLDDIQSVTINGTTIAIGSLGSNNVINGAAGTLTITAYNSTTGVAEYKYELTQATTDVAGAVEKDEFTLTTTDGTASSAQAKITIEIIDDVPTITVTAAAPADALVVDDSTLSTNATANFAGNFSSSPIHGADGATVSTAYALSVKAAGVDSGIDDVATGENVLLRLNSATGKVEGYTQTTNQVVFTVSVSAAGTVELDQLRAVKHGNASSADEATTLSAADLIVLTRTDAITDGDGDSASDDATLNIGTALSFKDDGPSITATTNGVVDNQTGLTVSGTITASSADGIDHFSLSGSVAPSGLTYSYSANGSSLIAKDGTGDTVFTLAVNANGTYQYTVVKPSAEVVAITPDFDTLDIPNHTTSYTVNLSTSGGGSAGTVTFSTTSGDLRVSNDGLGISDNLIDTGDKLRMTFDTPASDATFAIGNFKDSDKLIWKVYDANGNVLDSGEISQSFKDANGNTVTVAGNESANYSINLAQNGLNANLQFYSITLESAGEHAAYKFTGFSVDKAITVADQSYSFSVVAVDGDGDSSSAGSFNVTLDGSGSTLDGTLSNDMLVGGGGNDTLTGGLGADVFKWSLGDQGTTSSLASDVVKDFSIAQGDALDLKDLLQGEHSASGSYNLGSYLKFGVESGKLVLSVDHDGGSTFAATQKIVLDNFSSKEAFATALGLPTTSSDTDIINKMIQGGTLKTDV